MNLSQSSLTCAENIPRPERSSRGAVPARLCPHDLNRGDFNLADRPLTQRRPRSAAPFLRLLAAMVAMPMLSCGEPRHAPPPLAPMPQQRPEPPQHDSKAPFRSVASVTDSVTDERWFKLRLIDTAHPLEWASVHLVRPELTHPYRFRTKGEVASDGSIRVPVHKWDEFWEARVVVVRLEYHRGNLKNEEISLKTADIDGFLELATPKRRALKNQRDLEIERSKAEMLVADRKRRHAEISLRQKKRRTAKAARKKVEQPKPISRKATEDEEIVAKLKLAYWINERVIVKNEYRSHDTTNCSNRVGVQVSCNSAAAFRKGRLRHFVATAIVGNWTRLPITCQLGSSERNRFPLPIDATRRVVVRQTLSVGAFGMVGYIPNPVSCVVPIKVLSGSNLSEVDLNALHQLFTGEWNVIVATRRPGGKMSAYPTDNPAFWFCGRHC